MKKNFLITGGNGFLGVYWSNILKQQGHNVQLLIHKKKIFHKNIKSFQVHKNFSFHNFFKKNLFDCIINTASLANVELCQKKPKLAKKVHKGFVINLVNSAKKYNIYLIHVSTDHLFSGKKGLYKEKDKTNPLNTYAKTKLESEKIILENLQKYLIIRGNFFGWAPSYKKSFSDWIISSNLQKKKINVFDDVSFSPLYILNFIKTCNLLINKRAIGIFNVCSSDKISKYNFAKSIINIFKLNKNYIKKSSILDSNLTRRPLDMSLSFSKISKKLKLDKLNYSIFKQIMDLKSDQNKFLIKKIRKIK